ncbi:MAG: oligosaccharide flippase family protein [Flavobacteriales bacterium]|nr:oligosaccharide flippase family protein [Flavobacteriales bacterium]
MRSLIARGFKDLLHHKKEVSNTAILFASQILVLIIGLGIKTIQVRVLSPKEYGLLALFGTITSVIVLFFHYASFSSLKVLLANNEDTKKEKEFFGVGIIIAVILGILFSATLFVASFFVDDFLQVEIGNLLMLLAPFCFILPFQFFISEITIGASKLKSLAVFHLFSRILFIVSLFALFRGDLLNVPLIIILNLLSWLVATAAVLLGLKPSFKNIKENLQMVKEKNKSFGLSYYYGAIVNQSTYKLDELFITYFVNITQLGFYTLASIICSPMTFLSRAFVNSIFKKLALKDRIPIRVFVYNTLWLGFCVLFLYLCSDFIVTTLFGKEYMQVSVYILPLSIAFLFQGMYAPFSFLTVKSKGKELRNVAYAEAIVNVFGNIILVPTIGVLGAIFASILARFTHFMGLLYYYLKMIKA